MDNSLLAPETTTINSNMVSESHQHLGSVSAKDKTLSKRRTGSPSPDRNKTNGAKCELPCRMRLKSVPMKADHQAGSKNCDLVPIETDNDGVGGTYGMSCHLTVVRSLIIGRSPRVQR